MTKFYTLEIEDIIKETIDCVSIGLKIPEEWKNTFKYIQGQYITLKLNLDGKEYRRSYSICTSPVTEQKFRIAVKKVKNGKISPWLNETLKKGDKVEVMPPMGNFHIPLDPKVSRSFVCYAGGSGITPMMSIIKTILHAEQGSGITLFYANQDERSIIFKKELEEIKSRYPGRLEIYHILNTGITVEDPLFKGIMTQEKVSALIEKFINDLGKARHHFICGPGPMMLNVTEALQLAGVPKENVHLEYFAAPADTSEMIQQPIPPTPGNGTFKSKVTIICDGESKELELGADDTILEAALAANIDAPYACQGGSCCTCRARLMEGKVEMKVNYALLDSEVKDGYILTCQSRPLTPIVIVDYDKGR